ncbi:MAG: hypothetical protein F9K22_01890 [Bacteroidetes bacterium]|nr:MAG: hypothetical protein F9K22_01890 [Bacteroidota bacterium]
MGQQQLLLIILGVIIVGIAVAVGITLFQDNAVSSNKDAMTNDMMHLAAKARHFYSRPTSMGGGGHSFTGLTADAAGMLKLVTAQFSNNANGSYSIKTAGDNGSVVLLGIGKTAMTDGSYPTIEVTVTPKGQTISIVN